MNASLVVKMLEHTRKGSKAAGVPEAAAPQVPLNLSASRPRDHTAGREGFRNAPET